jgi:HprK-related kinase B
VSNDRLMIEPDGEDVTMYGVAKLPRINPGTILHNPDLLPILSEEEREEFMALSPDSLWSLEHKYDADLEQCFGKNKFRLTSPMDGLIILNWKRNGGPCHMRPFEPASRPDLLPAFMKSEGLFFMAQPGANRDISMEAYSQLLSRTQCLEISGGVDFEKAADAGLHFLETGKFL